MVPARCSGLRVFPRLNKQDGKNVTLCAEQMQQSKKLKEHVVPASRDQYLPQSQYSTPAGSEGDLTSESNADWNCTAFHF